MTQREVRLLTPEVGDRDHVMGPETAPVTLVEYGDYECPYCKAAVPIVTELQALLGEHLRYVFRHFPVTNVHPHSLRAAEVAEAAAAQGWFWDMHAYLFEHQDALDDEQMVGYTADLGLDAERIRQELVGHVYADRVREDFESALESGVEGTPTFFLDGIRYDGAVGLPQLLAAIRLAHPELPSEEFDQVQRLRIPRVVGQRSRFRPER